MRRKIWGRRVCDDGGEEASLEPYRPYTPLLQEILERLEGAAAQSDLDAVIAAVVDDLTEQERVKLLRKVFADLPVAMQWKELVARLPDQLVQTAIERERTRLQRLADPETAIADAIETAKATGCLDMTDLPEGTVIEIGLFEPTYWLNRTVTLIRTATAFNVIADKVDNMCRPAFVLSHTGDDIWVGNKGTSNRLVHRGELACHDGETFINLNVMPVPSGFGTGFLPMLIQRVRVNQQLVWD